MNSRTPSPRCRPAEGKSTRSSPAPSSQQLSSGVDPLCSPPSRVDCFISKHGFCCRWCFCLSFHAPSVRGGLAISLAAPPSSAKRLHLLVVNDESVDPFLASATLFLVRPASGCRCERPMRHSSRPCDGNSTGRCTCPRRPACSSRDELGQRGVIIFSLVLGLGAYLSFLFPLPLPRLAHVLACTCCLARIHHCD